MSKEAMESFKTIVTIEAHALKLESHGKELLNAIGYTYILKAHQSIAKLDLDNTNVLKKAWYSNLPVSIDLIFFLCIFIQPIQPNSPFIHSNL